MQKQMKSLFTTMLAIGLFCQSQAADLFTPVQKTELRAPSVPLITSDPYLSIWSPYDKLNEGSTEHWTGSQKRWTEMDSKCTTPTISRYCRSFSLYNVCDLRHEKVTERHTFVTNS